MIDTISVRKLLDSFYSVPSVSFLNAKHGSEKAVKIHEGFKLAILEEYFEKSPDVVLDSFIGKNTLHINRTPEFFRLLNVLHQNSGSEILGNEKLETLIIRSNRFFEIIQTKYPNKKYHDAWHLLRENVWASQEMWIETEVRIQSIREKIIATDQNIPIEVLASTIDHNPALARISNSGAWGYIQWLRSDTGKTFPEFVISGDTSMSTDGWASLTSAEKPEVIIGDLTTWEFSKGGSQAFADRLNKQLDRNDLRRINWMPTPGTNGKREQEDIYLKGGQVQIGKKETPEEFLGNGGIITGAFRLKNKK